MDGSPTPVFRGKVEHGKLHLERRDDFALLIEKLEGKDVEVILRRRFPKRTGKENRYLHALIGIMAWHCGNTPAEMKIIIKNEFGIEYTSALNTAECAMLIDDVKMLCAWLGIRIGEPEDMDL